MIEYAVDWLQHNLPRSLPSGARRTLWVRIRNRGAFVWQTSPDGSERTDLVIRFDGEIHCMVPISGPVPRGGEAILEAPIQFPVSSGRCCVRMELLRQYVAWFAERGAAALDVEVSLSAPGHSPTRELLETAWPANRWNYQPGYGAAWSVSARHYPQFARNAAGCLLWDADGREFVDYVMGWGSVFLGHANPRLCQAVCRAMAAGNMLALPHVDEMRLTRQLCRRIPSAEAVLFAKNGSDATTTAVRMARAFTGRRHIAFSGYHGWQDWNNTLAGSPSCGIPSPGGVFAHQFPTGNLELLTEIESRYRGDLAAVVIEPAAQVEGVEGPVRPADRAFLLALADLARRTGALLMFDEIFTGFRYPGGTVQQAVGIMPDLTCLGKALSSGTALSAVVGRRDIFDRVAHSIRYHPTFKGEALSFACALEALAIYDEHDVAGAVWQFGGQLASGIDCAAQKTGIQGRMSGMPFRLFFRFDEPDPLRRSLLRTLLEQELLCQGILTFRGFLLPSFAHDAAALERTVAAFMSAFATIHQALRQDDIVSRLELNSIL